MSCSIKNISISIGGVPSEKFDIALSDAVYHLDNFTLYQSLLSPNTLSFTMHKARPDEGVGEIEYQACSDIIGKDIDILLQTDNIEQISLHAEHEKTADIEFHGFITEATGNRREGRYEVSVEARSWDALLMDDPNCKSFENMTLNEIVNDVIEDYADRIEAVVDARYTEPIPYCVQYNETNYQFLQRLACRYGEWMYHDGTSLIFGNLQPREDVLLQYPSHDIPSYNVSLRLHHVNFNHIASSYNSYDSEQKDALSEMQKSYNTLNDMVFGASQSLYLKETYQNLHSGGYADSDSRDTVLNVSIKTKARGVKTQMLTYNGHTYCTKIALGSKLVIEDNFITDPLVNTKSKVCQDEILITEIIHSFTADQVYNNTFSGVPSECDWPGYTNSDVYPHATSCRAKVKDNEDPLHLGRVRVQFDWQAQQNTGTPMLTPWLRLAQPYAGVEKGFSFIPEIDEEVMIDFEGGNAERPYVKGMMFNGIDNPDGLWLPGNNQVKAIRTRNGHTIEIWDQGSGGYIRIYDNKKENYILTFSTDEKLIKLESTGNIELYAKNDIIMHAGHDINASADNDVIISADHDMQRNAENDIREYAGNDRSSTVDHNEFLSVTENQFIKIGDNKDEQIAHKLQLTAENIREEAQDKLLQYSTTHQQKASDGMSLNAQNRIDIKSGIVKIN